MTNKEKMIAGELYSADEELTRDNHKSKHWCRIYNSSEFEKDGCGEKLMKEHFAKVGRKPYMEAPFHCDYGYNIEVGDHFYANYDCIFVDICKIKIGNHVMLGPRVCIYTATHPIEAGLRGAYLGYGKEVTIGNHVWIGGNTVINPGVTIGNNVVIGAGSIVTKDIPDNVVAVGNPCKVIKHIKSNLNKDDITLSYIYDKTESLA